MLVGVMDAIKSQVGGAQDACTAGGFLCPQPQSFGASLNPCCWSKADTTYASTDEYGDATPDSPVTGVGLYVLGALLVGFVLIEVVKH